MDKPNVGIIYKLTNGKQIYLDVSIEVKELLEQTDRQIRSQGRRDRRHLNFAGSVNELEILPTQPQEDVADLVIRMDGYKQLHSAIEKLPEVQRRRLSLYYFEGLNFSRIAELEGVNPSAVGKSVKRAIEKLMKRECKSNCVIGLISNDFGNAFSTA